MKKNIFSIILLILTFTSCDKFEEINSNPEATEKVSSSMIATRIILSLVNPPNHKDFMYPYFQNKNVVWTEYVENFQYNKFTYEAYDFTDINDAHLMVEFAGSEKLAKSYEGLMHFARVIKFYEATMDFGDIPYSEALKGESDKLYFPKYDTQKEIFIGLLNELEKADQLFQEGTNFSGDPVYKGDVTKWRKLVNSYSLNLLIQLSKKESDSDLQVKQRFQNIVANKPIFTSNDDNYQLVRSDRAGQLYPFYKVSNNHTIYPIISDEIVNRLIAKQDRRLFYYAAPSPVKLNSGKLQSDFDAYVGIDPSLKFADITAIKSSLNYSALNDRYTELPTGEPTQQLSYSQLCFILAEGAARGWISTPAVDWYKKGVEASMKFIAANTPNETRYNHNMPLNDTYIASHLTSLGSAFPSSSESQIEEIITQKYLSSFLQSRFYAYYDYRRTGYPRWKINPESSLNTNALDKVPVRFQYHPDEFLYNTENVDAAVQRQFGGVDDINGLMWILK